MLKLLNSFKGILLNDVKLCNQATPSFFHTSSILEGWKTSNQGPRKFIRYNKVIYEPQLPEEKPRPAFVCHVKKNIKYSPKKMFYVAGFIRGMSIDEALKQLSFVLKKGAGDVKQTLLEAQELAVRCHNVEFKSNLWVGEYTLVSLYDIFPNFSAFSFCTAESFMGKGKVFKGARRHAKGRRGIIEYKHVHYFVRLEEGPPPEHFYLPYPKAPEQQLDEWVESMRKRKVNNSL